MVKSSVLFAIGVSGASGAKAKFLAVAAGAAMLATKMAELGKSGQEYQQVLSNLTTDMSLYNKSTKGLIDTMEGMTAVVELQKANIHLTAKEVEALGKVVTNLAQSTGKDATEEFKKLTKTLITGRESGLRRYGMEASQTEDKVLFVTEAVGKFVQQAENINIKIETGAERLYQFKNTLGTFTDQLSASIVAGFSGVTMFESLTNELDEASALYEETGGRADILAQSMHGLDLVSAQWTDTLGLTTDALKNAHKEWNSLVKTQKQSKKLADEATRFVPGGPMLPPALGGGKVRDEAGTIPNILAVPPLKDDKPKGGRLSDEERRARAAAAERREFGKIIGMDGELVLPGRPATTGDVALFGPSQQADLSDMGGGDFMDTSAQEAELDNIIDFNERKFEIELANTQRERALKEERNAWMMENDEVYAAEVLAVEEERKRKAIADGEAFFEKENELRRRHDEQMLADRRALADGFSSVLTDSMNVVGAAMDSNAQLLQQQYNEAADKHNDTVDRRSDAEQRGESVQAGILDKRAQNEAAAMSRLDGQMKEQFEQQQRFAVGQAIINTSLAAVKSFQSLAGLGPAGPALGAAAAAAAVAFGAIQIKTIKQQKYNSPGGASSAGGGGGALAAGNVGGGQGQEQISIDVKVSGSIAEIADRIEVEQRRQEIHGQRKVA